MLRAGLVVPDLEPDRYEFTHALIRHAVAALDGQVALMARAGVDVTAGDEGF